MDNSDCLPERIKQKRYKKSHHIILLKFEFVHEYKTSYEELSKYFDFSYIRSQKYKGKMLQCKKFPPKAKQKQLSSEATIHPLFFYIWRVGAKDKVIQKYLPKLLKLLRLSRGFLFFPSYYSKYHPTYINIFGGCNEDKRNKESIFLYIFSFHVQTQNIQSVLEQQIKYLQSKSRTTILLPCNDLLTSIGYKERMTPVQQLLKLIEKFSVYSFSDRIFSQFRYAFSYNLSASRHHFVNYMGCINIFGSFKDALVSKAHRCLFIL